MMTNINKPVPNNSSFKFNELLQAISTSVAKMPAGTPLFRLNLAGYLGCYEINEAVDLFSVFLTKLPNVDWSLHYTCNCCRNWFRHYVDLVWIDNKGRQHSLLWNLTKDECPVEFRDSIRILDDYLASKPIVSVFYSKDRVLGIKTLNNWNHLWINNPAVFSSSMSAHQKSSEKTQEKALLSSTFAEFDKSIVEKAINYLKSGTFYRAEKGLPVLEWLLNIYNNRQNTNLLWREVAMAPDGWCHVKNGVAGTLLDDIKAELPIEIVKRNWELKVDPLNYQRPTTISQGNVLVAEKKIADLGLESSLQRRFATLEDPMVHIWWAEEEKKPTGGLFSSLKVTKQATPSTVLPAVTMTWVKFLSTLCTKDPTVKIEAEVTFTSKLMSLVTAVDNNSKPILQWDTEDHRNPMSWKYENGGIDSRFKERVTKAGGQYNDVDIRISLLWDSPDDLDLHVTTPSKGFGREGELIYYGNKKASCGGWLDIDMNAFSVVKEPVENTRWHKGTAREGLYTVKVNNFRDRSHKPVPFKVEIEINGVIQYFEGVCGQTGAYNETVLVHQFNYQRNVQPVVRNSSKGWKQVVAIVNSPNMWGLHPKPQHGEHIFFLLKDQFPTNTVGGGLFVETLKSELHDIRSTLEGYLSKQEISGQNEGVAGIGNNKVEPWNLQLRVTRNGSQQNILIDRFD